MARARRVKRASRSNRMRGGWQKITLTDAAPVNDTSMATPTKLSGMQGGEYLSAHEGQHGGGLGAGAPVGDQGLLPAELQNSARVTPTLNALSQISGMSDNPMSGGRRRSRRRHGGGSKRRSSKRRSSKRRTHRKRQGGGATLMPASTDAPGMILPGSAGAEAGMNPEWKLAHNPTSFIPDAVRASVAAV